MRSKKRIIIISLLIILVSILIYTIALFCGDAEAKSCEWIKTVFSGVLASALVTLFVYVGEYFSERRIAVENYCDAVYRFVYHFRNLHYYDDSIKTDKDNFVEAVEQYQNLIDTTRKNDISDRYANLDFMIANKNIRNDIAYNRIYTGQRNVIGKLLELEYLIRNGNQQIIANKILECQDLIFEVEEDKAWRKVYNIFVFNMEYAAYDLLHFLYGSSYKKEAPDRKNYMRQALLLDASALMMEDNGEE